MLPTSRHRVPTEIDIYHSATVLIRERGEGAAADAQVRAESLKAKGKGGGGKGRAIRRRVLASPRG